MVSLSPPRLPSLSVVSSSAKNLTKAIADRDVSCFRELFVKDEPVYIVMQTSEGDEAAFTVADDPEAGTLSWADFLESAAKDLESQNYAKTEAQCLGILGDRMIMEAGRFNKDGVVYLESYSLVTLDEEGKITMFEAFTDPQASNLLSAAALKGE